jgi:hypothetical protein
MSSRPAGVFVLPLLILCLSVSQVHATLPSPWQSQHIGGSTGGDPSYDSGTKTFSVTGSGATGNSSDTCHFVYRHFTGDFDFRVKVESISNPNSNEPLAEVMIRADLDPNSLDPDAPMVFTFQAKSDPTRISSSHRPWKGANWSGSQEHQYYFASLGYYHRLVRHRDEITIYVSSNGGDWIWLGGYTLTSLPETVKVGMAVSSVWGNPATATFKEVSITPLVLPYKTSWIGNSLPGGSTAVQKNVTAMAVEPDPDDGRIFLNSYFEEAGREAGIYLPDGRMYGALEGMHGWGRHGGLAIASNGTYVYAGVRQAGEGLGDPNYPTLYPIDPNVWYVVRRYHRDGTPAPLDANGEGYDESMRVVASDPNGADGNVRGIAWSAARSELFVSDTLENKVKVYNEDLAFQREFSVTRPKGMAADSNGSVWIINGDPNVVVTHYDPNGVDGVSLTSSGWDPRGVAVDPNGDIWVADAGPDQQIKKFHPNGGSADSFGTQGGIFSGNRGEVGPLKLNAPLAVGVDSAGNVYVAGDPGVHGGNGGTELRKFDEGADLEWEKYSLEFTTCADADPGTDAVDLFSVNSHYVMDYSRDQGAEWTYQGMTIDPNYVDDARIHLEQTNNSGGVFVRRYQERRFLFVTFQNSNYLAAYRFADPNGADPNSEVAIPAVLFTNSANAQWPANHPTDAYKRWIWRDEDGDGAIDPNSEYHLEFQCDDPNFHVGFDPWGWYVDDEMNVWLAAGKGDQQNCRAITKFVMQGLNSAGVPIYRSAEEPECIETPSSCKVPYSAPDAFANASDPNSDDKITRAHYVASTDTMYVSGYTDEFPMAPPSWGETGGFAGRVIARYDDWSGTPDNIWTIHVPSDPNVLLPMDPNNHYKAARSISIAGDRLFVAMPDTGWVLVYNAETGKPMHGQWMRPGPEVAGETGWVDVPVGINAFQRSDGEYLVMREEVVGQKGLLFRQPQPLFCDSFETNPFTFDASNGGATQLVFQDGDKAVELQDRDAPYQSSLNRTSTFKYSVDPNGPLVERINEVLSDPNASATFEMSFRLERTAVSNGISVEATAGIALQRNGGTTFPTGTPAPSMMGTLAYAHDSTPDESSLEWVNRGDIPVFQFQVGPTNAGTITGLEFWFTVKVPANATPEAYVIDDLTVIEVP